MVYRIALFLHLLGATIWVGGHLVLLIRYVPLALQEKKASFIIDYEERYGKLGLPALFTQVITGIYLGFFHYQLQFMNFSNGIERAFNVKLLLLFCIFGIAIHAKFFVIPKLNDQNIKGMAWHIFFVNIISVLMLFIGMMVRFGGI